MKYANGKWLRTGFTTGACAAAASKAAAVMLFKGEIIKETELKWDGHTHIFKIENCILSQADRQAVCAVRKDAGDDNDITDGILIYSRVKLIGRIIKNNGDGTSFGLNDIAKKLPDITILGGKGVGTVTKPGLDRPVGSPAINSGPLRMIKDAVISAYEAYYDAYKYTYEYDMPRRAYDEEYILENIEVTVSVPGGEKLAQKTFNPELGITGGISILGTTGIVEPMSSKAMIETIRAEISVKAGNIDGDEPLDRIFLVPGSIGMNFAVNTLKADKNKVVKCSNFIGEALDFCVESGVKNIVIAGNIGKLVKLSGGIFNTHSRESDARMDIIIRAALLAGADIAALKALDDCVTTDAALQVLKKHGIAEGTLEILAERAYYYVRRRIRNEITDIRLIFISNAGEILCAK